jgi:hypothetical protein
MDALCSPETLSTYKSPQCYNAEGKHRQYLSLRQEWLRRITKACQDISNLWTETQPEICVPNMKPLLWHGVRSLQCRRSEIETPGEDKVTPRLETTNNIIVLNACMPHPCLRHFCVGTITNQVNKLHDQSHIPQHVYDVVSTRNVSRRIPLHSHWSQVMGRFRT